MFDSHKIDDYFDGEKPLDVGYQTQKPQESGFYRFAKLGFPCVAAALLGLMIVMPNIKKSIDLRDNITVPRKNEMDKLHMETTVFNMTDNKNRVNRLTADMVDEVEPKSQKLKIDNPHGNIPTDSGEVVIKAQTGYFTQEVNVLDLVNNVQATVDGTTVVTTQKASYDFNTEMGYGNVPIEATGNWGKLQAEAFDYDKKSNILTLHGYSHFTSPRGELTAEKENKYFVNEEKIVSKGNVQIKQNTDTLNADKVVSYLSESQPKELVKAEAFGNVKIKTLKETATGAKGVYDKQNNIIILYGADEAKKGGRVKIVQEKNTLTAAKVTIYLQNGAKQEIRYVEATGYVEVTTPKGTAKGNRGVYNPQKNLVELWDNVQIEQDGNFVKGDHAQTDLTTSVSKLMSKQKGGRVSGTFYKKRKK